LKTGRQILTQEIELGDAGNFTAVFDTAGAEYRPAGCATAVGRRFEQRRREVDAVA
jgi:hypothetical protein